MLRKWNVTDNFITQGGTFFIIFCLTVPQQSWLNVVVPPFLLSGTPVPEVQFCFSLWAGLIADQARQICFPPYFCIMTVVHSFQIVLLPSTVSSRAMDIQYHVSLFGHPVDFREKQGCSQDSSPLASVSWHLRCCSGSQRDFTELFVMGACKASSIIDWI